jgi:hypothetical protein
MTTLLLAFTLLSAPAHAEQAWRRTGLVIRKLHRIGNQYRASADH